MDDNLDYELSEPTILALKIFADGNAEAKKYALQTGQEIPEGMLEQRLKTFLGWLDSLERYDLGLMVIDLLTLTDALSQAVTVMRSNAIAEGLKDEGE